MVVFTRAVYFASVVLSVLTVRYCLELSDKCRNFSHKIGNVTDFSDGKRDIVLSLFGLWNLLFTVAIGASGDTAGQMLSVLGLSHEGEDTLIKANKDLTEKVVQSGNTGFTSGIYMFWDKDFQVNLEFKAIVNYGLQIKSQVLDYSNSSAAVVTAHSDIATSKTKLKIVLQEADFNTSKFILVSSVLFEEFWTLPFNTLDTTIEPFYNEKGEIIRQVYMMNQRNRFPFSNVREVGAFVLQLPYGSNDKYCMLILLPSPGMTVNRVYQALVDNFSLKNIFLKLNNDTTNYGLENIDIKIPRFEINTNSDPKRLLNRMGVYDMFDLKRANFSRTTSESIFVSKIRHSAHIQVTESGTSASASATALFADKTVSVNSISGTARDRIVKSDPVYSPAFIANRPFLYYVVERVTTTVIFGGAFSELVVF